MSRIWLAIAASAAVFSLPQAAGAYIGPGAGIGVIGSFLALLAALFVALAVVLFWPIRRILRRVRKGTTTTSAGTPEQAPTPTQQGK